MSKKQSKKLLTPEILKQALLGAVKKLDPRYMIKNPVMFVVEVGFFITLLLTIVPGLFGETDSSLRTYNLIVSVILLVTVLFANFAESVAEGRGKAQAASLKKTQKDTVAHRLDEHGDETIVSSSELKKGDVVMVTAGEVIPSDGEVIEGIASVDESAITGESAPVVRESGGDFCSVTGGTTVVSDWLKIRITSDPGNSFLDRMIALAPSTIMSTSSMWMQFSNPPKHTGMFLLTSTMTVLAHSHTAFRWEPPGPKLNQPCSSMGATWNMATSRLLMQLR